MSLPNAFVIRSILVLSCMGLGSTSTWAEGSDRVEAILGQMTTEQKVGQVLQGEIKNLSPSQVKRFGIGSVLNGGGSFPDGNKRAALNDWVELAQAYWDAALVLPDGTRVPPIWGTDAVHGHNNVFGATLFPHNIGLGATGNEALIEAIALATATEVHATGIDWVFAPTVAVAQDFRWGRTYESFGIDPKAVSRFGGAAVRGFEAAGMPSTAKHFIGDGGTVAGRDQGDVTGTLADLLDPHGAAYDGAFEEGVPTVMASFNSWNGSKVHGDKPLLDGLLRGEMGFDGMVVSDWNGIGQVQGCRNDDCAQAFNAGIDLIMAPQDWPELRKNLLRQLSTGDISAARLDEAVRRILTVKERYGLLDQPGPKQRLTAELKEAFGGEAHRALARKAVRESLVLLKNNHGTLPIPAGSSILVTGSGANDMGKQAGGWTLTWQGTQNERADFPGATTILEGFQERIAAVGGAVQTALDPVSLPDAAVVVFGEDPYAEGKGDRESLTFAADNHPDLVLMRSLRDRGIPVVAVFLTGRPMWVNREINASDAFVVAWLPGSEGAGVADVLLAARDESEGDVGASDNHDFVGRLPFAWPALDINELDPQLPVDQHQWPVGYGLHYGLNQTLETLGEKTLAEKAEGDLVIFRRGTRSPWVNYVGDEGNWLMPIAGAEARSVMGELSVRNVDVQVQEDGRLVTWQGTGVRDSQYYWKTPNDLGSDLTRFATSDGALQIALQVLESPKGSVKLRMDCGWPCRGELDVSKLFKRLPEKQWVRLSFPLACFRNAGADLSTINAPLVLVTGRPMSLVIYDAAIVEEPDPDAIVPCS